MELGVQRRHGMSPGRVPPHSNSAARPAPCQPEVGRCADSRRPPRPSAPFCRRGICDRLGVGAEASDAAKRGEGAGRLPDRAGGDDRIRRPRRELPRRARRAPRHARDPHGAEPAGGRGRLHGRGLGQADRPARHLLRHPRPRRHQRRHRHPHGAAGQRADDRLRRPGGDRHDRPRGVPGGRLSRRLRPARQMGDRDRRPGPHPGDRRPRLRRRRHRPARPGGGRAARGRARGAHRRSPRAAGPDPAGGRGTRGRRRDRPPPRRRPRAARPRRRRRLGRARPRRPARLRRGEPAAGARGLPLPGPARQREPELCRRRRPRQVAGGPGAHRRSRPHPRHRRALRRDPDRRLHALRRAEDGGDADPRARLRRRAQPDPDRRPAGPSPTPTG